MPLQKGAHLCISPDWDEGNTVVQIAPRPGSHILIQGIIRLHCASQCKSLVCVPVLGLGVASFSCVGRQIWQKSLGFFLSGTPEV